MKKLMLAVAIVCSAAMVQAAQVKWQSSKMLTPGGTANLSGATASLYILTASEYASIKDGISGLSTDAAQKYIYDAVSSKTADQSSTVWSKGSNTITEDTNYGANDSAYAVLVYEKTVDDKDYFIANAATYTFGDPAADKTFANMGTNLGGAGGAALAWQTVPEPTSGLLLLLGVAGLALKRKRA